MSFSGRFFNDNGERRNRAEAARLLGIHRQLLYVKMKRYGLDASEERTEGVGEPDD
jgi:DNA-binding NtrC family response regulator